MAIIIKPIIRDQSELPYHNNSAPGKRFVYVDKSLYAKSAFYIAGRRIESVPKNQPKYIEEHRHNCSSFYVFIGDNKDFTGLEAEVNIENKEILVKSPSTIMIPPFCLHQSKLVNGKGWFFHINLKGNYNESLSTENENENVHSESSSITELCKVAMIKENSEHVILNPQRWIFVDSILFQEPGIYLEVHNIFPDKPYVYQMPFHQHEKDEVDIIMGKKGKKLEIDVFYGQEKKKVVQSPKVIYIPPKLYHKYEYLKGEGLIMVLEKIN